jgi:hypothetical protein
MPRHAPQTPGARDLVTSVRLLPQEGVLVEVFTQSVFGGVVARFTTFDDGSTWSAVAEPFPGIPSPYEFQDANHWWLIGGVSLYKTADGGRSWALAGRVPQGLELIGVIDAEHAWAFDDFGYGIGLALTSNGGITWQHANVPVPG